MNFFSPATAKKSAGRVARKGRWAAWENAQLKRIYGTRDDAVVARVLGRPLKSVRARVVEIFTSISTRTGTAWTAVDDERLKSCLGIADLEIIALILRRSIEEITARLGALKRNIRSDEWAPEEAKRLKLMFGSREDEVLAIVFSRSADDIREKARLLHLAKDKTFLRKLAMRNGAADPLRDADSPERRPAKMPRWTAEQIELLVQLYPDHANIYIAAALKKSNKSIMSKANDIGLSKSVAFLAKMGRENVNIRYERMKQQKTNGGAAEGRREASCGGEE